MIILAFCFVATIFAQPAFGYLDPGTGSMLTSALVGLVASLIFFLKGLYYKGMRGAFGYFGVRTKASNGTHQLVFYSEGRQYWNTFKPVIDELVARGTSCLYLTSDEKDPGLLVVSELVTTKFIGSGSAAYNYLQFLEADVCVMTTPGLDVLQIKRSKGVKHYAYLFHGPTDAAIYKTYSFDYFDSIMTSGDHQSASIKKLEDLRGTWPKRIVKAGCLYYDEMTRRQKKMVDGPRSQGGITVLVAPTWGANGLLKKFGSRVLIPLLKSQYEVILRPHPQSYISEKEVLERLHDELGHYKNLQWDNDPDGMLSMAKADVMVSDLSGVVFDFAFLFEKPVITLSYELSKLGLEAADLPWVPWELTVLDTIGKQIDEKELDVLPEKIQQVISGNDKQNMIRQLREESVSYFGCAGQQVVNELLRICDEVQAESNSGTMSLSVAHQGPAT